jgi:hypothetical protein
VKVVITNTTRQHADICYWRKTAGNLASWNVPSGDSVEIEIPSTKDDNQTKHVAEQCRVLGLSFREGKL